MRQPCSGSAGRRVRTGRSVSGTGWRQWIVRPAIRTKSRNASRAFALAFDRPLDWSTVSLWLSTLRTEHGARLLRVKGLVNLTGEAAPVVIQGVQHVFQSPARLAQWPSDDRRSRIVFITDGLSQEAVQAAYDAASAAASSVTKSAGEVISSSSMSSEQAIIS